ncbi:hypothetical protein CVV72_38145 [Amycolatopsis sp. TNS106]|nr:hypothetical protein CVV72_38145 [Amycolatopsis sp. TNS106]
MWAPARTSVAKATFGTSRGIRRHHLPPTRCESHFRNVEGCESGFRNPRGNRDRRPQRHERLSRS